MRMHACRMRRRTDSARPFRLARCLWWWLLPALLGSSVASADAETVENLLTRLQFHETQRLAYRETRHMQLLSEPWQATGDLFIAPDRLVIVQRDPRRAVTEITATHLQHSDAHNDTVTRLALKQAFAVPVLKPFLLLLYGADGAGQLQREYRTEMQQTPKRWTLRLLPVAPADDQPSAMTLSGAAGLQPDSLMLEFADGDYTEWLFTPVSRGSEADAALDAMHVPADSVADE